MVRCNIGRNLAPEFVTLLRPIDTNDTSPISARPRESAASAGERQRPRNETDGKEVIRTASLRRHGALGPPMFGPLEPPGMIRPPPQAEAPRNIAMTRLEPFRPSPWGRRLADADPQDGPTAAQGYRRQCPPTVVCDKTPCRSGQFRHEMVRRVTKWLGMGQSLTSARPVRGSSAEPRKKREQKKPAPHSRTAAVRRSFS
jgi:hypothetical protein